MASRILWGITTSKLGEMVTVSMRHRVPRSVPRSILPPSARGGARLRRAVPRGRSWNRDRDRRTRGGGRGLGLERAVGSTDYTDSTDWKRVTGKLRAGGASCSCPSVKSVKSVDNPTAAFRLTSGSTDRRTSQECFRPGPSQKTPPSWSFPKAPAPPSNSTTHWNPVPQFLQGVLSHLVRWPGRT